MTFTTAARRDKRSYLVNIPYDYPDPEVRATMDPEKGATIEVYFNEHDRPQMRRLP